MSVSSVQTAASFAAPPVWGPRAAQLGAARPKAALSASPRRGRLATPRASGSDSSLLSRRSLFVALALTIAASTSLVAAPSDSAAELVRDQYGVLKQTVCPVAYFPCWQSGQFCFRPIYCEGDSSVSLPCATKQGACSAAAADGSPARAQASFRPRAR